MALPLPTPGWQEFGNAFGGTNKIFQDLMQRALERQKLREMSAEHAEDYGLRKEAGSRAAQQLAMQQQLAPLQKMLLQAQATKAQNEADPMFKFNQLQNVLKMFGSQAMPQGQESQGQPSSQMNQQQDMPQDGQSFIPSIGNHQQQQPPQQMRQGQSTQGMNWAELAKNPVAVAAFKQAGIDLSKVNPHYAPSNTGKELQERADVDAGFYPNTNREQKFENPDVQQEYSNIYSSKTTGLPKGQHYILGDNGERVGIERPRSAKERDIERGSVLFNQFFPIVNEGLNYYSGEDSITKLENDAKNYKTDPAARKRFDQFLIAEKLGTVTGVNEAARFGAGRTNQTFNRFYNSLSSFDVPKKVASLIKQFQIPSSANLKSGLVFNKILNKADDEYKKTATPTVKEYYPGKAPSSTTVLIGPNGQEYDVPNDKVNAYLQKHKDFRRG